MPRAQRRCQRRSASLLARARARTRGRASSKRCASPLPSIACAHVPQPPAPGTVQQRACRCYWKSLRIMAACRAAAPASQGRACLRPASVLTAPRPHCAHAGRHRPAALPAGALQRVCRLHPRHWQAGGGRASRGRLAGRRRRGRAGRHHPGGEGGTRNCAASCACRRAAGADSARSGTCRRATQRGHE